MKNNSARNSSIELLRIIAMIMIVFHHFAVWGGFEYGSGNVSIPEIWYHFMSMGGKIGVNIFFIISGYFLVRSEDYLINIRGLLKFWGQLFVYSLGFYLLWVFANLGEFEIEVFWKYCRPISSDVWWFSSVYFIIYILHPFLNKLIKSLSRREHQLLIFISLAFWCIIPTFTKVSFQGSKLEWGITVYILAAYISLYGLNNRFSCKGYLFLLIITILISMSWSIIMCYLSRRDEVFIDYQDYLFTQEYLPIVIISVSLFMLFINYNISYNKAINVIGAATFGIYLFHEHPLVRYNLWENVINNNRYQDSELTILYSIGVCLSVFAVGVLIDIARKYTIEKLWMKMVNWLEPMINRIIRIIIGFVCKYFFGESGSW